MRPRTRRRLRAGLIALGLSLLPAMASAHERQDDPEELYGQPVAFQLRLGYETLSTRLDRVSFSGRADAGLHVLTYEREGIRERVQLHGVSVQPNLVYQPSAVPLQLLVGLRIGFGLGAPPDYTTQTAEVTAVPNPDQLAIGLRAGTPLGLRFPFGPFGLRAEMRPGVAMVTIDEHVQSPHGSTGGASVAAALSLRGQGGFDLRLGDLVGLYVDGGYDLGAMRGWSFGAGLAILGEPAP